MELQFQRFIQLSQSVFQNLKQDMGSVAVFSRRENPPPSIFALANPSTQTKKIRFISAPLSGPVSSAFQNYGFENLSLRYPHQKISKISQIIPIRVPKPVSIFLRFSESFNAIKKSETIRAPPNGPVSSAFQNYGFENLSLRYPHSNISKISQIIKIGVPKTSSNGLK